MNWLRKQRHLLRCTDSCRWLPMVGRKRGWYIGSKCRWKMRAFVDDDL